MSVHSTQKRLMAPDITAMKKRGEPIVALTAYHAHTAAIADKYCDFLLVGDSLGMVMHGFETTVPVPLDLMIMHGRAVVRGARHALVVVDMPFGSYEESPKQAFRNAAGLLKETGAAAVKLEGGAAMAPTIAFLTARGIPVIGHVGLTPQAVNMLGGYRARGRDEAERSKILADAKAVADAGAIMMVLESVIEDIAAEVTQAVPCPTIGIGASASCDGQVLVTEDMLGLFERTPRFVKRYDDFAGRVGAAAASYAEEVKSRRFPGEEQLYRGA
jgi:3-methyl-2-oxobutanoate hydroxymethyltransferase